MTHHMTCDAFAETLADFLERDVVESTRAAMESHALACGDCGALLADLRQLRIDASSLPELAPSHDLWSGIAARIDAPVIPIGAKRNDLQGAGGTTGRASAHRARWTRMAAAAVLLVAATSATTYYLTVRANVGVAVASSPLNNSAQSEAARAPLTAPAPDSGDRASVVAHSSQLAAGGSSAGNSSQLAARNEARFISTKRPTAEQVYDNEIGRLRAIVERRRAQLDPVTISIVERNLKVIDEAIAQCRSALAKDPASRFLMESLNNALENKVELLRTAALLPSRT